jgi:hypothetical protein
MFISTRIFTVAMHDLPSLRAGRVSEPRHYASRSTDLSRLTRDLSRLTRDFSRVANDFRDRGGDKRTPKRLLLRWSAQLAGTDAQMIHSNVRVNGIRPRLGIPSEWTFRRITPPNSPKNATCPREKRLDVRCWPAHAPARLWSPNATSTRRTHKKRSTVVSGVARLRRAPERACRLRSRGARCRSGRRV